MAGENPDIRKLDDILKGLGAPPSEDKSLFESLRGKPEASAAAGEEPRGDGLGGLMAAGGASAEPAEADRRIQELEARLAQAQEKAATVEVLLEEKEARLAQAQEKAATAEVRLEEREATQKDREALI